jgi:hypothetical protein
MAVKKTATRSREFSDSVIDTIREPLIALDQDLEELGADYFFDKVAEIEMIPKVIAELAKVRIKIAAPAAGFE